MAPMVTAPPPQRRGLMAKERGSGTALFISRCIAKFYNLSQRVCTSAPVLARVNERREREWSSFFGSGMGHFWFISLCCFSSSARCFTLCFAEGHHEGGHQSQGLATPKVPSRAALSTFPHVHGLPGLHPPAAAHPRRDA